MKKRSKKKILASKVRKDIDKILFSGSVDIKAAEATEEGTKLRSFMINAYNGGAMDVGFGKPVIVDLSGMEKPRNQIRIFKDHDNTKVLGHADIDNVSISASAINASGVFSGSNEHVNEVITSSDNGFVWEASIGAEVKKLQYVKKGETVLVNGQTFQGDVYVARKTKLKEISFVALGADDSTSTLVAEDNYNNNLEGKDSEMNFKKWLEAKGFSEDSLSEAQLSSLKAMYESETNGSDSNTEDKSDNETVDISAQIRAEAIKETKRIAAIKAATNGNDDLLAQALENNWSAEKTELEAIKAERKAAPNLNAGGSAPIKANVIEAAMAQSLGLSEEKMIKAYGEEALSTATKEFKGQVGLQEVLLEAARQSGRSFKTFRGNERSILQAAFSTVTLPTVFSNIANKFIGIGFDSVENSWRSISKISPVRDFKTITRVSLVGDYTFEEISPDGEIPHGKPGELSYSNKADTFAKMISITRQDIINDDLGVLQDIPMKIGRGGALKLNLVFWTAFLDNASFFTVGNGTLLTGAGSALGISGLTDADVAFLNQTDPDGNPLGVAPKILLVGNNLKQTGKELMNSTQLLANGTGSKREAALNVHAGNYNLVVSTYLNNTTLGGSTTGWYLLADPMDMPVIETVFLNGVQRPIIENTDADFNTLGVQMRGYYDFGVAKQEYRGGVKSAGV